MNPRDRVWLFDLDDTLHNASHRAFTELNASMTAYIVTHLGLAEDEAVALRHRYWLRYGATLSGLQRHNGVKPAHFLHRVVDLRGDARKDPALARKTGGQTVEAVIEPRLGGARSHGVERGIHLPAENRRKQRIAQEQRRQRRTAQFGRDETERQSGDQQRRNQCREPREPDHHRPEGRSIAFGPT